MDTTAIIIADIAIGSFFLTTIGFAVAWARARERAIRAEMAAQLSRVPDDRFRRLEQAVEAIAVEVERIAEGQRFTARLLAERGTAAAPSPQPPARVITPH